MVKLEKSNYYYIENRKIYSFWDKFFLQIWYS